MDGKLVLHGRQREVLLSIYRSDPDPEVRKRAHILLLLADGRTWAEVAAIFYCSSATLARWKNRFEQMGVSGVRDDRRGRTAHWTTQLTLLVVHWIVSCCPRDFGFLRSRWTCSTVVVLLMEREHIRVSRETVRRRLHEHNLAWRRPRPVVAKHKRDRQYAAKMAELKKQFRRLRANETIVFQDEVDINTNPEIGAMWMRRARQAAVVTPGDNQKCYIAGSIHWRTGTVIQTTGARRNADLFIAHLDALRRSLRRYRKIHVILDNARFHRPDRCKALQEYIQKWRGRIVLHFLPVYSPETNPMERVWWHLRNEITRNHRCESLEELLDLIAEWAEARGPFAVEGSHYPKRRKPKPRPRAAAA